MHLKKSSLTVSLLLLTAFVFAAGSAQAQAKAPKHSCDIRDDIGWFNISTYNHGAMDTALRTLTALQGRRDVHRLLRSRAARQAAASSQARRHSGPG